MKRKTLAASAGTILVLSGCTSLSGLDAKSHFACKAPDGILCESMSGIYANAQADNLPGQRANQHAAKGAPGDPSHTTGVMSKPIHSGMPIRSAPRLLRVWFSPWEDSDGDLHDQSYVYLAVDSGRWLIEHNQRRIQETYRPVRAPNSATSPQAAASDPVQEVNQNRPGSQDAITGGGGDEVVIDARQDRMSNAQVGEFLNGMLTPDNALPATE